MAESYTINQPEGYPTIHVRQEDDGGWWVGAGDEPGLEFHRIDDVVLGMLENVSEGKAVARTREDGQLQFKLTAKGQAAVENMISTSTEAAAIYADAQRWAREEKAE